jgi:hypothetical protein
MRSVVAEFKKGDTMKKRETRGHQLMLSFIALVFALTMYPTKARAQVTGDLEADIPFQFHVGNAKLSPGNYIIHMVDNTDLNIMEISSADGSISALFPVRQTEANSTPAKSELIFNKYGHRYFLEQLVDESSPSSSAVAKSGYEKRIAEAAAEGEEHVPAHHRQFQGK